MILPQTEQGKFGRRLDVLSADEENVLSEVRSIVSVLKANGAGVALGPVRTAVMEGGAAIVYDNSGEGSTEFKLGSVRFVLRSVPEGIEISFPNGDS